MTLAIKRPLNTDLMFIGGCVFVIIFAFYSQCLQDKVFFAVTCFCFGLLWLATTNLMINRVAIKIDKNKICFYPSLFIWKSFACETQSVEYCGLATLSNMENDEPAIRFLLDLKATKAIRRAIRHPYVLRDQELYVYGKGLRGSLVDNAHLLKEHLSTSP